VPKLSSSLFAKCRLYIVCRLQQSSSGCPLCGADFSQPPTSTDQALPNASNVEPSAFSGAAGLIAGRGNASSSGGLNDGAAREAARIAQVSRVCDLLDECFMRGKYAGRAGGGATRNLFDFGFSATRSESGGGARADVVSFARAGVALTQAHDGRGGAPRLGAGSGASSGGGEARTSGPLGAAAVAGRGRSFDHDGRAASTAKGTSSSSGRSHSTTAGGSGGEGGASSTQEVFAVGRTGLAKRGGTIAPFKPPFKLRSVTWWLCGLALRCLYTLARRHVTRLNTYMQVT
jgi:hypothetical protein